MGGSVQQYSNSSALAMELLQSCTEPPIFDLFFKPVSYKNILDSKFDQRIYEF